MFSCFSSKKQQRQSFIGDELHAFDLTWRNYLPSASQFCCCCFKNKNIRLEDDDPLIEPPYYNDHTLYRGEALQSYLDNPRDWEFESVLGQQNDLPRFVTRNPFGTSSMKRKKSQKRNKKHRKATVVPADTEEQFIPGYTIQHDEYCNDDAEFLGDDQIANLAYNRHSSQMMDQYGEELYAEHMEGPTVQEMQAPPREFYAARTMPDLSFNDQQQDNTPSSSSQPLVSVEAAQALLSDRLDDLTEKLAFIKNNIIHIRPSPQRHSGEDDNNDDDFDRTTLHTIHREEESNASLSDMDSIASEALDVYESTNNMTTTTATTTRRYSSGDELHIPSLADNTPFSSDQHPFSYFTEHHTNDESDHEEPSNNNVNNNAQSGHLLSKLYNTFNIQTLL